MGKLPNAAWGDYIANGVINDAIANWHADRGDRVQSCASPSTLTECPRVVWLKRHGVPKTNVMGWGKAQRLMLGRITENLIAQQLHEDGKLLWHWKDDHAGESKKFEHGEGLTLLTGTPDLLIRVGDQTAISDSKTGRSDGYKWVPTTMPEIWDDPYWYKYKLQLTAYFLLCHWNKAWFAHRNLPLPELCHLFSYSLDDGIVRRELVWKPTKEDAAAVNGYVRRWNEAYAAEDMPDCTCKAEGTVKFCAYSVVPEGSKVGTMCCDDNLRQEVL